MRNIIKRSVLLMSILVLPILIGCKEENNSKEPSNSLVDKIEIRVDPKLKVAREIFESQISNVRFASFTVEDFEQVDGFDQEIYGMKIYQFEFKATLKSQNDVDFYHRYSSTRQDIKNYKVDFPKDAAQVAPDRARDPWFKGRSMKFKAGAPIVITGAITLQKTEKSWREYK